MSMKTLEKWYSERCNGDWEHQGGVTISTLDNPGWSVEIAFDDLEVNQLSVVSQFSFERSEGDFAIFSYDETRNIVAFWCGAHNLEEAFDVFFREYELSKLNKA